MPLRHAPLALLLLTCAGSPLPDHYATLGVAPSAAAADIKRAFRQQALLWHPDKQQNATSKAVASERMREVNDAYSTLNDAERRGAYDKWRAKISALGEWYPGHRGRAAEGPALPAWLLAYLACPAYAEFRYGFLTAVWFCPCFLLSHLPLWAALLLLHRRLAHFAPRPPLAWLLAALRAAILLLLVAAIPLLCLLTISYSEVLYLFAIALLLPVALAYLILPRVLPRKTLQVLHQRRRAIVTLLCRAWADLDPPAESPAPSNRPYTEVDWGPNLVPEDTGVEKQPRPKRKKAAPKTVSCPQLVPISAHPPSTAPQAPAPATTAPSPPMDDGVWTRDQQSALEAALRKYPAGTSARWKLIEAAVPGKSKQLCIERFQALASVATRLDAPPTALSSAAVPKLVAKR